MCSVCERCRYNFGCVIKFKFVFLCLLLFVLLGGFVFFFMVLEVKVEFCIVKGYVIGEFYDYGFVMYYGFNFFSVDFKRLVIVKLMLGGK